MNEKISGAMLAARLHDPPEKALVLMRTPEGHEGGTSRELARELFENGVPEAARAAAARADQWASAADRAAFPRARDDGRFPAWQQVRFHDRPVIIHPLTGREFDLISLFDVDPAHAKAVSIDHLRGLVHSGDLRRTALAFWRFGPEIGADELRSLWRLLPADTRVPDHTIWDHLDLTAAFAAAFASDPDGGPALLSVSLGPVQDFIAASRSTSDLWAGSHLLARLSWEAMRVVCEELGPESILFPRLRGVPQVDLWLRDKCGLDHRLFEKLDWSRVRSDANPLFAAALPNRFTALVPASAVHAIAEKITVRVRSWARDAAKNAFREVLDIARMDDDPEYPAYAQIAAQFEGFPEIHWAAVPWSLVGTDGSGRVLASDRTLADAMQPYFESTPPGYLATPAWLALAGEIELEQGWFWKPNPGALYPALHELLDRVLAATKATRPFPQLPQQGWRCSLTGETEWLTTNRDQLGQSFRTQTDTVWAKASQQRPTLIRPGEHLGAQATLKRMWPRIFTRELGAVADIDAKRFVVSTHALALSATLERWINSGRRLPETFAAEVRNPSSAGERVLLPKKLSHLIAGHPEKDTLFAIPGWLEKRVAAGDDASAEDARGRLAAALGSRIEAYYGLLLFDGDRMGAWLSADRSLTLSHDRSFHPQVRAGLARFSTDSAFSRYASSQRGATPSRHMAISEALNHFALRLAPAVVEDVCMGRMIYSGGDDVLAMVTASDLLRAMVGLRAAFSGSDSSQFGLPGSGVQLTNQGNGFAMFRGQLLRLMGDTATGSCGAVIAHHQAPLGAVVRELRAAEQRAKNEGGRDAFSITLIKRSGGSVALTAKWGKPLAALSRLRDFVADEGVSRRAVYNTLEWLRDLPSDKPEMIAPLLGLQLERQADKSARDHHDVPGLARLLSEVAWDDTLRPPGHASSRWLEACMSVAEFLARDGRANLLHTPGGVGNRVRSGARA